MIDRTQRLRKIMTSRTLDGLVCSLPVNVFMVSGYAPVIGNTLAIAGRDAAVTLLVPEDEKHLAAGAFNGPVQAFAGGSLEELKDLLQTQRDRSRTRRRTPGMRIRGGRVRASSRAAPAESYRTTGGRSV